VNHNRFINTYAVLFSLMYFVQCIAMEYGICYWGTS